MKKFIYLIAIAMLTSCGALESISISTSQPTYRTHYYRPYYTPLYRVAPNRYVVPYRRRVIDGTRVRLTPIYKTRVKRYKNGS